MNPESPLATYLRHAAEGRLAYQYSSAADKPVFYPRLVCPYTGSTDLEWRVSTGSGTVYSKSTVPASANGQPAYSVALVDIDEGFRLMSTIVAMNPDDVFIGMRVSVDFAELDGVTVPVFRRQES